ncbi:integral membrane protein [Ehrlichia ruminantium]|uniref:hypothetical protein n=1 Tax=Ehrlichia ruminantium TaxID=779 RepID=UPI0007C117DE|nr:hypothetical protein [Ehrlichia ruminantium]QLK52030.1 hypothetical protein FDZ65_00600 [Ehrlichia ruminantium]QLK53862.1 hypothetical protein FDZ63_00595 [Ehrlichia ruminantium]GAT75914.1 integral membrane protein [Ehrlichia ruminantium]
MTDQPDQSIQDQIVNTINRYRIAYDHKIIYGKYRTVLTLSFYSTIIVNLVSMAIFVNTMCSKHVSDKHYGITIAPTAIVVVLSSILLMYLSYKTYIQYKVDAEIAGNFSNIANTIGSYLQDTTKQYNDNLITLMKLSQEISEHAKRHMQFEKFVGKDFSQAARVYLNDKRLIDIYEEFDKVFSFCETKISEISAMLGEIHDSISTLVHEDYFTKGLANLASSKLAELTKQNFCMTSFDENIALESKLHLDFIDLLYKTILIVKSYNWPTKGNFISKSIKERADKLCDVLERVKKSFRYSPVERFQHYSSVDMLYGMIGEIDEFISSVVKQDVPTVTKANKVTVSEELPLFLEGGSDTECLTADDKKTVAPSTEDPEGSHEDGNELQESSVADIKDQDVVSNTKNDDSKWNIESHVQDSTTGSGGNFFTQMKGKINGKINGLLKNEAKFPDDSSDTKCLTADDKKTVAPSTEDPEGSHEDGNELQESSVADIKDQDVVSSTENDDSKVNIESHVQDSTTGSGGNFFTQMKGKINGKINGLLKNEAKFPDDSSDTKCLTADGKKTVASSTEEPEGFHEDGNGLQESSVADIKDQDVVSNTENDDSKGNIESHVQDSTTGSGGKFFTRVIGSANGLINKFSDFKKAKIVSHNSLAVDQQIAHEQEVKIPVVVHACDKLKTNCQISSSDIQLSQGGLVNVDSPVSSTDSSSKFADDEHRSENDNLSFGDDVTNGVFVEFCEEAVDYVIPDSESPPSMVTEFDLNAIDTTNGMSNASQPTDNVLPSVVCGDMPEVKDVSESDSYEGNSCNGINSNEDNPSQEVKGLIDDHQVSTDHHFSDSVSQDLYGLPVLHEVSIENDDAENSCVDKKDLTHDPNNDSTSKLLDLKSGDIPEVNTDGLDRVSQNEPSNNTVNSDDVVLHQDVHDLLENESTMEHTTVDPDDTVKHKDNESILSMLKRKLLGHTEKSSSGEVKKCEDGLSKDTTPNIINEPKISNDTVTLSIREKELEATSPCVDDSSGVSESVCATHSETGFEVDTTDVSQCQEKKSYFSGVGDAFQKAVYNIKDTFSSSKKDDSSEVAKKTEETDSTTTEGIPQVNNDQERINGILLSLVSLEMVVLEFLCVTHVNHIANSHSKFQKSVDGSLSDCGDQHVISNVHHVKSLQNSHDMVK